MDKSFEDSFNSFYLKLTLLNYRHRTKLEFSPEQVNTLKLLKLIIPIFNRLEKNNTITIEDVKNFNPDESGIFQSSGTTIQNNSNKKQNVNEDEVFIDTHSNDNDDDEYNEYNEYVSEDDTIPGSYFGVNHVDI